MNTISNDLIRAVRNGQLENVRDLVNQYGLSHSEQWAHGYVLLSNSIELNHTEIAKLLLKSGAKVNNETNDKTPFSTPLHFAVENGNQEIIEILLKQGANIYAKDSKGCTPLFLATAQGNEDIIEIFLNRGANICGNKNGTTLLHVAAKYGLFNIAEKLLRHGSYVNLTCYLNYSSKGFTALHFAVEENKEKIALLLLSHGANVDARSQNMKTPLHIATEKGFFTIVELLLSHGACVNAKTTEDVTPLYFASEKGNVKLIKLLLRNNADIDTTAKNKMTPLYIAIRGLHREAAKFLMDKGARVDAEDEYGRTILSFAVERGLATIVEDILQHLPDISNVSNKNSFKIAARSPEKKYFSIVEDLLKYGFSVEPEDVNDTCLVNNSVVMGYIKILEDLLKHGLDLAFRKDQTLLHTAVKSKQTEVAKFLINHGADVNATDKLGKPPIFYSTENSDVNMTKFLLIHGANIHKSPELLRVATQKLCREIVEVLLQNQAEIEATDEFGRTALHMTAFGEYDRSLIKDEPDIKAKGEIAKLLLTKSANVNAKTNSDGFTALHMACQKGFKNVAEILLQYKADVDSIAKGLTPLHIAARHGKFQIVEMLLINGASANFKGKDGQTSLHIAAKNGHSNVVNVLLMYDADIESKDIDGATPLHFAAAHENSEIVLILLQHGAFIDAKYKTGKTALHIAIRGLHRETAKFLMDKGATVDAEDENGRTILSFAVESGLATIVEDILHHLPDINNVSNKNSFKIAARSHEKKYFSIVEDLLKYGFSVEAEDVNDSSLVNNSVVIGYINILEDLLKHGLDLAYRKDETLLHTAVKSKQTEVAKFLINHGADVNATDKLGKPPIFYSTEDSDVNMTKLLLIHGANVQKSPELLRVATQKLCKEIVEVLLQNQADTEATDEFGRTALHMTALGKYNGSFIKDEPDINAKGEIAKLLLTKGANVNAKTKYDGLTALHMACQKSFINIAEILLQYKADVDCIAKGFAPLHIAAKLGKFQIVETLLVNGASVNFKRKNAQTSLHIAAKNGHSNVVNVLLMYDADIESKDINGAPPLHLAAAYGNYEIVLILLQHGAFIDAKDKTGKTALHIASELGKKEVVKLLLKFGSDINILTRTKYTAIDLTYNSRYSHNPYAHSNDIPYEHNEVIKILKLHLIKLKTGNLFVNKKNLLCLRKVRNFEDLHKKEYQEEIERLKSEKMGSKKASLYDILTKNITSLTKFARNEDIRRLIDSTSFEFSFPIYSNMIQRNFKKGVERNRLLNQAQEFFSRYFELPYHCSDQILSYLSDGDLMKIIGTL